MHVSNTLNVARLPCSAPATGAPFNQLPPALLPSARTGKDGTLGQRADGRIGNSAAAFANVLFCSSPSCWLLLVRCTGEAELEQLQDI